jgi:hypothetical protein
MKEIRTKELILGNLLEGLNQASGAASLLIHHQQNTFWMRMRDVLELTKAGIVSYSVDPLLKPKQKEPVNE